MNGERVMTTKDLVKSVITVQSVRTANARIISGVVGVTQPPSSANFRVTSKVKDVATAGQHAMQSLKKK
jgi:hypothetical protein